MKTKFLLLLAVFSLSGVFSVPAAGTAYAQPATVSTLSVIDLPTLKVRRSGPYIGLQQGKYNLFELGGEIQFKKAKLIRPTIHGFRFGLNYDIKNEVLGYEAGYWYQHSRVGLTYGILLSYRTNFDHGRIGLAPALGFRFTQFHLQTGYHFLSASTAFKECNTFFIALKFVLINKRKRDWDK